MWDVKEKVVNNQCASIFMSDDVQKTLQGPHTQSKNLNDIITI
jgi:hypothetical protein